MANKEHLKMLKTGVEAWNEWRQKHPTLRIDLSNANFSDARLVGINLSGVDLSGTNFTRANLQQANLSEANLFMADLGRADLRGADMWEVVLNEASLEGAKLVKANLRDADIFRANLLLADMANTNLSGASMREAYLNSTNLGHAILKNAVLTGANLSKANLYKADLSGAHLNGASLVKTNLEGANLANCTIARMFAWDINLHNAIQSGLIISEPGEPVIAIDDFEAAQLVYLLLHNYHIRSLIEFSGKRAVLVIGKFPEARESVAEQIRNTLREMDYVPILFNISSQNSDKTNEMTRILIRLSRFVIADLDSDNRVARHLTKAALELPRVAIQPICAIDTFAKNMDWPESVLPIQSYQNLGDLSENLIKRIIEPAIAHAIRLEK